MSDEEAEPTLINTINRSQAAFAFGMGTSALMHYFGYTRIEMALGLFATAAVTWVTLKILQDH